MTQNPLVIYSINGPVVTLRGRTPLQMMEMVYVGHGHLIGEVINVSDEKTTIQVYESTTGLRPGEPVVSTGAPMTVMLGPGLLREIFDGIARPLRRLEEASGAFIAPGIDVTAIPLEKQWHFCTEGHIGAWLTPGTIIARCAETAAVEHRVMLPPDLSGELIWLAPEGDYSVTAPLARIRTKDEREVEVTAMQKWPIRTPRLIARRLPAAAPLITGQRVIDTLFPIAKGGAAAIPGGFGTGKTMLQHQLAKFADADIIVYVGCGERGNEMTQVLTEFSALSDPRTGKSMLDRTVLIANTSNMPVAAREASIYTGITMAEYFRDMGYHVALMADSTSRWAEALREISGRLEEMPAEEGYPAYLPSRLSAFYERAGYVETLSGKNGSVTLIGAVSPQGNDFSEPVTQNTKRFIRCFWALEKSLAYSRHYPAINWMQSYSEYTDELDRWYRKHIAPDFVALRTELARILSEENELMEIVKLIGADLLADEQKLVLEIARVIRVGFLQQNAMHPTDCYVPIEKQYRMMKIILALNHAAKALTARHIPIARLTEAGVFDRLIKSKFEIPNDQLEQFDALWDEIQEKIDAIVAEYA